MKIRFDLITEKELAKLKPKETESELELQIPKTLLKKILILIIAGGFLLNQYLWFKAGYFGAINKLFNINISVTKK